MAEAISDKAMTKATKTPNTEMRPDDVSVSTNDSAPESAPAANARAFQNAGSTKPTVARMVETKAALLGLIVIWRPLVQVMARNHPS
jgi:hypothetical protein